MDGSDDGRPAKRSRSSVACNRCKERRQKVGEIKQQRKRLTTSAITARLYAGIVRNQVQFAPTKAEITLLGM